MPGKTISTTVTFGVILGSGDYPSPLTITSTGAIAPSAYGTTALHAAYIAGYVLNQGTIAGGIGARGASRANGGTGGTGLYLAAGSATNEGTINGGGGGYGGPAANNTNGGTGGAGGLAVDLRSGVLTNNGAITGGLGGNGGAGIGPAYYGAGGAGGGGVNLAGGSLINAGVINGGQGGGVSRGLNAGGAGGVGIEMTGGSLTNNGTITGAIGAAGYLGPGQVERPGGSGASAIDQHAGSLTNASIIRGGAGGSVGFFLSSSVANGGRGGSAVHLAGGQITNFGTMAGGSGGVGGYTQFTSAANGDGGSGVDVVAGNLANHNLIYGGFGGGSPSGAYFPQGGGMGGSGVDLTTGTVINDGAISGGGGGFGGDAKSFGVNTTGFGGRGGAGGTGVRLAGGVFVNDTTIVGGTGGDGGSGGSGLHGNRGAGGDGGNGGSGAYSTGGGLINGGTIIGGNGGTGGIGGFTGGIGGVNGRAGAAGVGVLFHSGGTLTNAGFIGGGNSGASDAVYFGSGAASLILDPGASFNGAVIANGAYSNVLDLASGASSGSITGLGIGITGFGTIRFDPAASWLIAGDTAGLASGQTVDGFTAGDTIGLSDIAFDPANSVAYNAGLREIIVYNSGHAQLAALRTENVTIAAGQSLALTGGTYTDIVDQPLCFLRNTKIRTTAGDTAIQDLRVGDRVCTLSGTTRPIVWIGTGRVLATQGRRNAATPVIVRQGALADNVPAHDLRVTKGHSLFIDDVLIPVEFLVNHRSILWDDRAQEVELYHLELDAHDVVIADGAPAESYRDDGNRWLFRNANGSRGQAPRPACAPVLTGGPVVDAAWRRLLERSGPRPVVPTTDDPDLHVVIDGNRIDAAGRAGGIYRFRLPRCPRLARVVSRAGRPDELGFARDPRLLGVALRRVMLWRGARLTLLEPCDPALDLGFHQFESDNAFRWTNGDAMLPAMLFDGIDGACELELHVACTTRYPLVEASAIAMAA